MVERTKIDVERLLAHMGQLKPIYSVDELANSTPISRFTWYKAIESGALAAVKQGDKTLILLWDLIAYLNSLPSYTSSPERAERSKRAVALRARRTATSKREPKPVQSRVRMPQPP